MPFPVQLERSCASSRKPQTTKKPAIQLQRDRWVILFALALSVALLAIDLSLPPDVASGALYAALVPLGWWLRSRHGICLLAALSSLLIAVGYLYAAAGENPWVVLGNSLLGLLVVWLTALLLTLVKRYEAAAHSNEQQLLGAVESVSEGFILYDADERLVLWNQQYSDLYPELADFLEPGMGLEEVLRIAAERGQNLEAIDDVDNWLRRRLNEYRTARGAEELRIREGRWVRASQRRTASGGIVGIRTDITESKRAEAALIAAKKQAELADRAKSEFLACMSHELRTPLTAVIGFAEIIEDELYGPVGSPSYLDSAHEINLAGQHLLKLINDILDLSKIQVGQVDLQEHAVDIRESTSACLALVRQRAEERNVTLEQRIQEEAPALLVDERRLKQILVNLLSNAIKFTPAGGTVTLVACVDPGDGFLFEVSDTGIGMTADDIPKAMSPFGQVDGQLNRMQEGGGLGLPLSRSLVELHGGSLDLRSEIGVGTTVTVSFPAERIIQSRTNMDTSRKVDKAAG